MGLVWLVFPVNRVFLALEKTSELSVSSYFHSSHNGCYFFEICAYEIGPEHILREHQIPLQLDSTLPLSVSQRCRIVAYRSNV